MATQEDGRPITLAASGDLSGAQYRCVKIDINGRAAVAGTGEPVVGILQNRPSALGDMCVVYRLDGTRRKAYVGAAGITAGVPLASDSTGRLVAATKAFTKTDDAGVAQDALSASWCIGISLAAGSVGELGTFIAYPYGAVPTTTA